MTVRIAGSKSLSLSVSHAQTSPAGMLPKIAAVFAYVNGGKLINWFESLKKARRSRAIHLKTSRKLYESIVKQSREPSFYSFIKIPDTVDGRFELIVLHLFLLLYCFRQNSIPTEVGQNLINVMIDDLDRALRQMGTGDLSVGRKVKKMAGIIQIRLRSYQSALESKDGSLNKVLSEIFFASVEPTPDTEIKLITDYVHQAIKGLSKMSNRDVMSGIVVFPVPPGFRDRKFRSAAR